MASRRADPPADAGVDHGSSQNSYALATAGAQRDASREQAAKAETTPKQTTGVAASSDSVADDRCSWSWRSGKSGGRLVIAVRRLSPAAATATTSSAIS